MIKQIGLTIGGTHKTNIIKSPMPGLVLRISVNEGDVVEEGDELVVVEAMKMETPVMAPFPGTVQNISIAQGDQVQASQFLLEIV